MPIEANRRHELHVSVLFEFKNADKMDDFARQRLNEGVLECGSDHLPQLL